MHMDNVINEIQYACKLYNEIFDLEDRLFSGLSFKLFKLRKEYISQIDKILNNNIFDLSRAILEIANSNPQWIIPYTFTKDGYMEVFTGDREIEYFASSNKFIVNINKFTFEVFYNSHLYGERKKLWEEHILPVLLDKYKYIIMNIIIKLDGGDSDDD